MDNAQMIAIAIEYLSSPDPSIRQAGAKAIAAIGTGARAALPILVRASHDPVGTVRQAAVEAIGRVRWCCPLALSALTDALSDESPRVRWTAVEGLREVGPLGPKELPTLRRALRDENGSVRWRAAEALAEMGPAANEAIPDLIRALGDKKHWVRWHSDRALGVICNENDAISHLTKALRENEDADVRVNVVQRISKLSTIGPIAIPALIEALHDPDSGVRAHAALTLGKLGPRAGAAVHDLMCALSDSAPRVRSQVAVALGRIKFTDRDVESALFECLSDSDHEIRRNAAVALSNVARCTDKVIRVLVKALESEPRNTAAWLALMYGINSGLVPLRDLEVCSPAILECILPEVVALGVLPTVGLKIWQTGARVEFPSAADPYPWEDRGVYHNWMSHAFQSWPHESMIQACFHSDWFEDVHLISASQLVLFHDFSWNRDDSPALIEGKAVGLIVQSGGNLLEVEGMRPLRTPARTNRIDFLFSRDLRLLQYLVFSAVSAQVPPKNRRAQEIVGADVWTEFVEGARRLLTAHGLGRLAKTQCFCEDGWKSSRYLVRYERPFCQLKPALDELIAVLRSPDGEVLRSEMHQHVEPLLNRLEHIIWVEGMRGFPEVLMRSIAQARPKGDDRLSPLDIARSVMRNPIEIHHPVQSRLFP